MPGQPEDGFGRDKEPAHCRYRYKAVELRGDSYGTTSHEEGQTRVMAGNNRERSLQLWGWLLFTVCAGFFIASAVSNGDKWGIAGSIIFFAACIVFIIPLIRK